LSQKIKHIAVIRLSAMGDVAMTVPLLHAFVKQYPNVKITVVSKAFFKPFFDGIPNVDFFAADTLGRHKGFLGLMRLSWDLRQLNIDAVADLHNVLRSAIIRRHFAFSGKKTAHTDKARAEKKALTRAENKIFKPLTPVTERHAKVFEMLGFPIDLSKPEFPEKQKMDAEVANLAGEKNWKWIGIAPFAQHQSKVYPKDLMQQVIDQLAANPEYKIFLLGAGPSEKQTLNELVANHPNVVVVAGKISFGQELQLISNLDVMLSMDSGNAHISAMYGVNTITLWGATHPFTGFAPFHQPLKNALVSDREKYPKLPTSIYGNIKVEGYEDAMRTISPETVVQKIETILNSK
jgi:ADP-heptose:LPS heptosyltransferase